MHIKVYEEKDQGDEFYALMGRYFADKMFLKLLGESLYNEPESTWFIALEDKDVLGFCAAFKKPTHIYFNNFYVKDKYRNQAVGSKLYEKRLGWCKKAGTEIRSMVKDTRSLHLYKKNGFSIYGKRGYYNLVKWCSPESM